MTSRGKILWALSAILLAWGIAMAGLSVLNASCARDGARFRISTWGCEPLGPAIILQRDLQRG